MTEERAQYGAEKMIDEGGPAFPLPYRTALEAAQGLGEPGMTKREWFAGMAMVGYVVGCQRIDGGKEDVVGISKKAFALSDAMLKLSKEK